MFCHLSFIFTRRSWFLFDLCIKSFRSLWFWTWSLLVVVALISYNNWIMIPNLILIVDIYIILSTYIFFFFFFFIIRTFFIIKFVFFLFWSILWSFNVVKTILLLFNKSNNKCFENFVVLLFFLLFSILDKFSFLSLIEAD